MRINPSIREKEKPEDEVLPEDRYNRKAALVMVFIGVYFFLIKILFL